MWYTVCECERFGTVWLRSDPFTFALGGRSHHSSLSFTVPGHSPHHHLPSSLSCLPSCLLLKACVPTSIVEDRSRLFCNWEGKKQHVDTYGLPGAEDFLGTLSDRSQKGPYPPGPPALPQGTQKEPHCGSEQLAGSYRLIWRALAGSPREAWKFRSEGGTFGRGAHCGSKQCFPWGILPGCTPPRDERSSWDSHEPCIIAQRKYSILQLHCCLQHAL